MLFGHDRAPDPACSICFISKSAKPCGKVEIQPLTRGARIVGRGSMRKSRAKQSPADRMKRLCERCCLIHNVWLQMEPLGGWEDQNPASCWVAACPRKDCDFWIYVYQELGAGPWAVPAQFSHLLAPDFANPNEVVWIEPSEKYNRQLRARFDTIDQFSQLDTQLIRRC
jgi:hypothetical protein